MISTIQLKPYLFLIKHNGQVIGQISTLKEGAFFGFPREIYHKLNAFGINKELFNSCKLKFNLIVFLYKDVGYLCTREKFLAEAIEQETKFGIKKFLPLSKWQRLSKTNTQLNIPFPEVTNE